MHETKRRHPWGREAPLVPCERGPKATPDRTSADVEEVIRRHVTLDPSKDHRPITGGP